MRSHSRCVCAELRGLRFCLRGYTLREERAFSRRGRIHTRTILLRRLVSFLYGTVKREKKNKTKQANKKQKQKQNKTKNRLNF